MRAHLLFRLILPVAAISLLLLGLGTVTAYYVQQLHENVSELLANQVVSIRAAERLEMGIREVRTCLIRYLLTGDRKHLEAIPDLRRETDSWLAEAERLALTDREQVLIDRARHSYARFFATLDQEVDRPSTPAHDGVLARVEDQITRELLPPIQGYRAVNEEDAEVAVEQNRAMTRRMSVLLVLVATCGGVAGLLVGYGVARGVSRSIIHLDVPIRDAAGKLSQVVGPITVSSGLSLVELEGVLQRIALEIGTVVARLQHSQREVLRGAQLAAVGQLAAGLAHEQRNPLTAMKILVQSARSGPARRGLSGRDLEVLEEEITRLEVSIRTVLDFARPSEPEKAPVDVRGVAEQTLCLIAARAQRQGVRVACELPARPLLLEADAGQLRQVLLNLLVNSLDVVPRGGSVRVGADGPGPRAGHPGRWLSVWVADTGPGVPADVADRLFEPFVTTKETGTGLGLSICRRIVEAHGGVIGAANGPGGGAVFTVRLPCPPGGPPGAEGDDGDGADRR